MQEVVGGKMAAWGRNWHVVGVFQLIRVVVIRSLVEMVQRSLQMLVQILDAGTRTSQIKEEGYRACTGSIDELRDQMVGCRSLSPDDRGLAPRCETSGVVAPGLSIAGPIRGGEARGDEESCVSSCRRVRWVI